MRLTELLITFTAPIIIASVGLAQWDYLGLCGKTVNQLRLHDNIIYAGTDDGIYYHDILQNDTIWTPVGLQGKTLEALLVVNADTILAGINVVYSDEDTAIYLTTDGGSHWNTYQNGFGGGTGNNQVEAFASVIDHPETLYAINESVVAKSTDFGLDWDVVWGEWGHGSSAAQFIYIDPYSPNNIWTGGETGFMQAYFIKSEDYGANWNQTRLETGGDNACYCIAIHPENSDIAFLGMEGRIMKTTNGGDTWNTIYTPVNYPYIAGIIINPENPLLMYAAGFKHFYDPQALVLHISEDGGDTWNRIVEGDAGEPGEYAVYDMFMISEDVTDIIYLGTRHTGVYTYTNTIASIDDDKLHQPEDMAVSSKSYPNPFNCRTTISFELNDPMMVKLSICNINGQIVDQLISEELNAGFHSVTWDAESQASGVYFYTLSTGDDIQAKKLLLVK